MKIIDLLNKIAKGEEMPKKIRCYNTLHIYDEGIRDYVEYGKEDNCLFEGLFKSEVNFLNDEVEIVKDKTEEMLDIINDRTEEAFDHKEEVNKDLYYTDEKKAYCKGYYEGLSELRDYLQELGYYDS